MYMITCTIYVIFCCVNQIDNIFVQSTNAVRLINSIPTVYSYILHKMVGWFSFQIQSSPYS